MKLLHRKALPFGAKLLAQLGVTQDEISRRLKVSRSLVGHWLVGRRKPSPDNRRVLQRAFKIPSDSWDDDYAAPVQTSAQRPRVEGAPAPSPAAAATPAPAAWVPGTVRLRAAQLDRSLQRLIAEIEDTDDPSLRSRWMGDAAKWLTALGRLTGETLDEPEEVVVKKPAVRRVLERIAEVASPWPDALRAISAELHKLDKGASD